MVAVAEAVQAPPEVALGAALSCLSACTRGTVEVHIDEAWNAGPLAVWTCALLDSGERKSAAHAPIVAPLVELEAGIRRHALTKP